MPIENTTLSVENLLDSLRDGVWRTGADGATDYVNPALCRILARDADEIIGRHPREFTTSYGRHLLGEMLQRRKDGIAETVEFPYVRGDGRIIWCRLSSQPLFDNDEQFQGVLAVVTDITAERALREQQEAFHATIAAERAQLETILEMLPVGVLVTDLSGHVHLSNTFERQISGSDPRDLVARASLVYEEDRERVSTTVFRALETTGRWTHRFRIVRPDGSVRWVESRGRASYGSDGNLDRIYVATFDCVEPAEAHQQAAA